MNQDLAVFIVPFALILACGLLTAGGLYFIDIRYLKNARYAVASLAAGAVVLAVLEIVLYGSSVGFLKEQQLKTSLCELDAESAHPEARRGADPVVLYKAITGCMKEAGYEWDAGHRHCKDAPVATNHFCYAPTAPFDRAITLLQMSFE
ncbi:MAG: hypothetical protein WBO09_10310 [Methylocystis silviterrae]|uniref:hypothetical protein n=1 Tax=Methylocystis silviterrae TaxID=2743612 RepID=UPI003C72138A